MADVSIAYGIRKKRILKGGSIVSLVDFNLVVDKFKAFAEHEIEPFALDLDLEPNTAWLKTVWQKSEVLGMPRLPLPESVGGSGYPDFCLAILLDVLAAACPGVASVYAHHYAACLALMNGDEGQIGRFFNMKMADTNHRSPIFAVLFPQHDRADKLNIRRSGDGLYVTGQSCLTGNASFADRFLVFADDRDAGNGMTCVVIDSKDRDLLFYEVIHLKGLKMNPMAAVYLKDVYIPTENIVGIRGEGKKILEESLFSFHNFISAMIMGSVRNAWKKAFDYAEDRYQFGAQIIHHHEVQRVLRRMMQKLDDGTSAYLRVLEGYRGGGEHSLEDTNAIRKLCRSCACDIILDALKIQEGSPHISDYGLEKIIRDVEALAELGGGRRQYLMYQS